LININTQISIEFNWSNLTTSTALVLGASGPTSFVSPAPLSQQFQHNTPIALALQMGFVKTIQNQYDIQANFNNDINHVNWYFNTDGNPASNQFDFMTVVTHEFMHGLGFIGLYSCSGSSCSNANNPSSSVSAFDQYIERGDNSTLHGSTDSGTALYTELTSDDLYYPTAAGRIKLFAPSTYIQGSSVYHVDDNTYYGTNESMMSPYVRYGEAQHFPGYGALGVLGKMGYSLKPPATGELPTSTSTATPAPTGAIPLSGSGTLLPPPSISPAGGGTSTTPSATTPAPTTVANVPSTFITTESPPTSTAVPPTPGATSDAITLPILISTIIICLISIL